LELLLDNAAEKSLVSRVWISQTRRKL
jgi:hypothetical protein